MNERISFIDYWRGIAVYGMIAYHFFFDLELFGITKNVIGNYYFELFADFFRFSFLFLVGVSAYLFHSKKHSTAFKVQLIRFGQILACALLVSAATYSFDSSSFVFWGILHLIAFSSVYFAIFGNSKFVSIFLMGFLILFSKLNLETGLVVMQIFGFEDLSRSTLDFFPLFPWFIIVLLGNLSAPFFMNYYKKASEIVGNGFTCKVGRKSLAIYMLHQPILLLVLFLLQKMVLSIKG